MRLRPAELVAVTPQVTGSLRCTEAMFGKTVFESQNTKVTRADLKSQFRVGWAHLDW